MVIMIKYEQSKATKRLEKSIKKRSKCWFWLQSLPNFTLNLANLFFNARCKTQKLTKFLAHLLK